MQARLTGDSKNDWDLALFDVRSGRRLDASLAWGANELTQSWVKRGQELNIESIQQFLSWLTNTDLFPRELYFLSKIPAKIAFGETTAVVIMALTLSFLATLYPSWRAARLDPVDALRYE